MRRFLPVSVSLNFLLTARVDDPVAMIFKLGELICPDFQDHTRVAQLMHFVEHHYRSGAVTVKQLRVGQNVMGDGKIAVNIGDPFPREALRKSSFSYAPHPGKPDDRCILPGDLYAIQPKRSWHHGSILVIYSE